MPLVPGEKRMPERTAMNKTSAVARAIFVLDDEVFTPRAMRKEADVKAGVKRFLASYEPIWLFMPVQNGFGVSGTPDFVGCYKGRSFGIECKFGMNQPTPMQVRQQTIMASAGSRVWIVNEQNFHNFVREWREWVL